MFDRSHDLIGLANDALGRKHPVPAGPALIEPLNDDRREHPDNPGAKNPSPAQRPHPAAVTGFSLSRSLLRLPSEYRSPGKLMLLHDALAL